MDSRRRRRERPQEHVASRLQPGGDAVETQEAGEKKAGVCAGRVCKQHVRHHPDRHRLQKGSDAVSRVDLAHAPDEGGDGPESEHPLESAQRVREERWQVVAVPEAVERPLGGEKYQAQPRCRLRQIQSRLSYLRRHPESRERVDQRGGPQAKRLKVVRPERPGLQVLLQLLQRPAEALKCVANFPVRLSGDVVNCHSHCRRNDASRALESLCHLAESCRQRLDAAVKVSRQRHPRRLAELPQTVERDLAAPKRLGHPLYQQPA